MDAPIATCLRKLVDEFFADFLGLATKDSAESTGCGELTSLVQFTGAFRGHCAVRLDWEAARFCSAAMLDIPEAELTEEDIIDAVSEFSNVIAGMMQAHLPPSTGLALPVVVEGLGYRTLILHTTCVADLLLDVGGVQVGVSVNAHNSQEHFAKERIRCAS